MVGSNCKKVVEFSLKLTDYFKSAPTSLIKESLKHEGTEKKHHKKGGAIESQGRALALRFFFVSAFEASNRPRGCFKKNTVEADLKSNGCSNKNFFSMEMRVGAPSLVQLDRNLF